jgi:GTPase Era involved in 16S rRNA processing
MNSQNKLFINIAIIGCISAGKSTLINSLFLEDLATMKVNRCTMVPQIYREANKKIKTAKEINKESSIKNEEIRIKLSDPNYVVIDPNDFIPMEFFIHKIKNLDMLNQNLRFAFYDIPGINDPGCHKIYNTYVEENFKNFDIVIFLINIENALTSKDEIDILNMIISKTVNNERTRYIIPIINKSDNMTIRRGTLYCDKKYDENYSQIITCLNNCKQVNKLGNKMLDPMLYSAQEAYMYRNLKVNPNFELTEDFKITIGLNDMGRRFYSLSKDEQDEKLKEIIGKSEFIDDMIKMSGFNNLINLFESLLTNEIQFKMCFDKINIEYKKLIKTIDSYNTDIDKLFSEYQNILSKYNKLVESFSDTFDNFRFNIENDTKYMFDCLFADLSKNTYDINILNKYLSLLENICNYQDHTIYILDKIQSTQQNIYNYVFDYYQNHYEKKWNIDELLSIIENLKSYNLEKTKINNFTNIYINELINKKSSFYDRADFSDYKNVIEFDITIKNMLIKLNSLVDNNIIKDIYELIIMNKIDTLVNNINSDNNVENSLIILYNLMIFYQYNTTKKMEFSNIYSILLLNMIKLINLKKLEISNIKVDKEILSLDDYYVNVFDNA